MKHSPILETAIWPDEAATQASAERLAHALVRDGLDGCLYLHGDLGAGKTTWVRYLLRALGVQGRIKSPTYAVVEPYTVSAGSIWHFDFYRFHDPREWEDAGFRDLFAAPGLKLCEWSERVRAVLPLADLEGSLRVVDEPQREVRWVAHTERGQRWLA